MWDQNALSLQMTDLQSFKWLKIKDSPNQIKKKSDKQPSPPKKTPKTKTKKKSHQKKPHNKTNEKNPIHQKTTKFEEYHAKTEGGKKG